MKSMSEAALIGPRIRNPFGGIGADALACGYSNRGFGNMSLCYGPTEGVLADRRDFLAGLGIDFRDLVSAHQVHGSAVKYATDADKGSGALVYGSSVPATDGLITDKKNVPLSIFTADCLSIFLYDPKTPAVGLVHAGWRSSRASICGNALRSMRELFGTDPSCVYAALGPAIRDCCYEVSAELNGYFPQAVISRGRSLYLDLALVNRGQLAASGVRDTNIFDSGGCTYCGDNFFSYRRQGASCGRMMSVIMLK